MSWMARCDELGDRREPVGLGNSVGSDVDAALTFKAVHGRVVDEPPDRAAREQEFDAVTELRRVNLSPENRFEASALPGIPLPPGLSGERLRRLAPGWKLTSASSSRERNRATC